MLCECDRDNRWCLRVVLAVKRGVPRIPSGGHLLSSGANQAMIIQALGTVVVEVEGCMGSLNRPSPHSTTELDSLMSIATPHTRTDRNNSSSSLHFTWCLGYSGGETPLCNRYCKDNIHCTYITHKKKLFWGGTLGVSFRWFFFFFCVCARVLCARLLSILFLHKNDVMHVTRP